MSEKIICPWCGAEMWFPKRAWELSKFPPTGEDVDYDSKWWARGKCLFCSALSPIVYGETEEAAREWAKTAALRRYTPPIKPMTLEELITTDGEVYMDGKYNTKTWACRCFGNCSSKTVTVYYITMDAEVLNFESYGRVWRCWERKPTDDERGAVEWEK